MNLCDFKEHALTDLYYLAIIQYMCSSLRQYVSGQLNIDMEAERNSLNDAHTDEEQDVPVEDMSDEEQDVVGIPDDDYPAQDNDDYLAPVNNDAGFQDKDLGAEEGYEEGSDDDADEPPVHFHAKDFWKFTDACLDAVRRSALKRLDSKEEYQTVYAR